jgi:hypothetical protein
VGGLVVCLPPGAGGRQHSTGCRQAATGIGGALQAPVSMLVGCLLPAATINRGPLEFLLPHAAPRSTGLSLACQVRVPQRQTEAQGHPSL